MTLLCNYATISQVAQKAEIVARESPRSKRRKGVGKGPVKTSAKALAQAERSNQILKLRAQSFTLEQIAEQVGLKSASAVHNVLSRAIQKLRTENVEACREMEVARLDEVLDRAWEAYRRVEAIEPLDEGELLAHRDHIVRILQRRAKLLGIEAPVRHEIEVSTKPLDQVIAGAVEQLRAMGYTVIAPGDRRGIVDA